MYAHSFPFDPTYGYDQEKLLQVRAPQAPQDYADFWQSIYRETLDTPLVLEHKPSPIDIPGYDVLEVYYNGLDGFRVGAWALLPQGSTPTRAVVSSHGYGDQTGPNPPPAHLPPCAWLFVCGRGFGLSRHRDLPNSAAFHVIHGIRDRRTYLHLGCVADLWRAFDAALMLAPTAKGRIDLVGGSFGGGIGTMALAWEHRYRKAFLAVPSFGHHPLRLTMPCRGSGESVRMLVAREPGIATGILPYFDSAIAARYVTTPTLVAPALFDPAVPPPGQFAVANELASRGAHRVVIPTGHFDYPGLVQDQQKLGHAVDAWFA